MESANEDASAAVLVDDEEGLCDALGRGADPNYRFFLDEDYGHFTLLTYAACFGSDGCCYLLLARGADPNLSDGYETPMNQVCLEQVTNDPRLVKCLSHLLDAGVDPNLRYKDGYTALHYLCKSPLQPGVKLLIQRGANIEATTNYGMTPLGIAVSWNCRKTALTLLRAGAKLKVLKYASICPMNRKLNDYMVGICNEGGWAARAQKHQDACLRVVSRCAPLPRDVMLSIVSYWSLPH